jgi:type I restriction enzyme S subunit
LYHSVTTEAFVGWLVGRAQGAAYPAVRAEDFSESPLIIPPSQILSAFHTHAEPWARLANNLHKQNLILRRIRDLLLPRLMSGQLSVTAAEAAAP